MGAEVVVEEEERTDFLFFLAEEGLGEVSGVGVEVIWVAADTPPPDGQGVGNGAFGGWAPFHLHGCEL